MEIDITPLLTEDQFALSHSRAEGGENAGRNTWNAALERAEEIPLLDTPQKLDAMRDLALESGGWNQEEVDAWTPQEVNALFLQWVAGDCRQCPAVLDGVTYEQRPEGWFYRTGDEPNMKTGPFGTIGEAHQDASPGRGFSTADSLEEIDWEATEEMQREGLISYNLLRADDGRIYFSLDS